VSLAIDFDTGNGYNKFRPGTPWQVQQSGFRGHADVYMGVFWNNKWRRSVTPVMTEGARKWIRNLVVAPDRRWLEPCARLMLEVAGGEQVLASGGMFPDRGK
jgi:hypothetical protein